MNNKKIFLFVLLPAALIFILYLIYVLLERGKETIPLYIIIYSLSFIFFFISFLFLKKNDLSESRIIKLKLPYLIILAGILYRVVLIPSGVSTSGDVYRYIWEGRVLLEGFNPFTVPPESPELEYLRDEVYEKVTFKYLPAIYPPLSQLIFASDYFLFGDDPRGFKIFYLLFEILTLIFLLKLLRLKGINQGFIILYSWLPLPVMEYFVNAHLDAWGITFMIISLYFIEKNSYLKGAVFLAMSFLSKLYPLILLPLMIKKLGFKKSMIFYVVFAAASALIFLPFVYSDLKAFSALFQYLERWEFNGSVYKILRMMTDDNTLIRLVCGTGLLLVIAVISFIYKDLLRAAFGVFLGLLIFSATLYPWYLGWIASLNPFMNFYSVLSFFFTTNFSNVTPMGEVWREYTWVLIVEYIPFFTLLGYDLLKRFRKLPYALNQK